MMTRTTHHTIRALTTRAEALGYELRRDIDDFPDQELERVLEQGSVRPMTRPTIAQQLAYVERAITTATRFARTSRRDALEAGLRRLAISFTVAPLRGDLYRVEVELPIARFRDLRLALAEAEK